MPGYMPTHIDHVTRHARNGSGHLPDLFSGILAWFPFFGHRWREHRKIARDTAFLKHAPTALLDDIGLRRENIDTACKTGWPLPR
ncbi:hypothetical protein [Thalassospira marina]|nr:hypothetical protein [Thalassospira marina]